MLEKHQLHERVALEDMDKLGTAISTKAHHSGGIFIHGCE
jgi:hypothetical protein